MKICFYTDNINTFGGIQRCVCLLSNELIKKGYQVDILCMNKYNDGLFPFTLNKKINVIYMPNVSFINKSLFFWTRYARKLHNKYGIFKTRFMQKLIFVDYKYSYNNKLVKTINNNNYDYVIPCGGANILSLGVLSKMINAKIIGWQHSSCEAYFKHSDDNYKYMIPFYMDTIKQLYDYVVLTYADKKWFSDNYNINTTCIYNMKSFISNKASNLKNNVFIAVGRFTKEKNYSLLIDSFYDFSKKNKNYILNIFGDGKEKEELQRKIDNYNLNNRVFLKGFSSNIKDEYLNSTIFISTSIYEGLPMVAIEAMECGLPIIASNIPVYEEITKNSGYIVSDFLSQNFSKIMLKMVNDPKKMQKMANESKKFASVFSKEEVVRKWQHLFEGEKNDRKKR